MMRTRRKCVLRRMRMRGLALCVAAATAAAVATVATEATGAAAAVRATFPQEFTQLKEGGGRDVTISRCIVCHSLEYIPSNAPAMNRAGWEKSIQKMRDRFGAPITDEEARQILDYLAANYSGKP
jgi:sulfite dehydrogenase (cytochrome) subunit B